MTDDMHEARESIKNNLRDLLRLETVFFVIAAIFTLANYAPFELCKSEFFESSLLCDVQSKFPWGYIIILTAILMIHLFKFFFLVHDEILTRINKINIVAKILVIFSACKILENGAWYVKLEYLPGGISDKIEIFDKYAAIVALLLLVGIFATFVSRSIVNLFGKSVISLALIMAIYAKNHNLKGEVIAHDIMYYGSDFQSRWDDVRINVRLSHVNKADQFPSILSVTVEGPAMLGRLVQKNTPVVFVDLPFSLSPTHDYVGAKRLRSAINLVFDKIQTEQQIYLPRLPAIE